MKMQTHIKTRKIELVWITVKDFDKSIKFFTEVVGMELMNREDSMGWAELRGNDGSLLGIAKAHSHNPHQPGSNAVVTITIDNMEVARKELQEKGAKLIGDVMEVPGHVKLQMFVDVDNNYFQLVESLD